MKKDQTLRAGLLVVAMPLLATQAAALPLPQGADEIKRTETKEGAPNPTFLTFELTNRQLRGDQGDRRVGISAIRHLPGKTDQGRPFVLLSDTGFWGRASIAIEENRFRLDYKWMGRIDRNAESIARAAEDRLLVTFEDPHEVREFDASLTKQPARKLVRMLAKESQRLAPDKGLETIVALGPELWLAISERLPDKGEETVPYDAFVATNPWPKVDGVQDKHYSWAPAWFVSGKSERVQLAWYRRHGSPVDRNYTIKDAARLPESGDLLVLEYLGRGKPRRNCTAVRRIPALALTAPNPKEVPVINGPAQPVLEINEIENQNGAGTYEGITTWTQDGRTWVLLVADNGHRESNRKTRFLLFEVEDEPQ